MSKKKAKKRYGYIIVVVLFIIIILLLGIIKFTTNKTSSFKFISRLDKVNSTVIGENNKYKTVGWIRIEGTNIDLPIIIDTEKKHDYPAEYEGYAWVDGEDTKIHNINYIKGHNIFNLSYRPRIGSEDFKRFEDLMAFTYYDFASKNNYFQLTLDGEEYVYQIFNFSVIPNTALSKVPTSIDFSKEEMDTFLNFIAKYNIYDYSVKVDNTDNITVLETCTRMYGVDGKRTVWLIGKRIDTKDNFSKVKVKKGKNYEKIEKILKGEK